MSHVNNGVYNASTDKWTINGTQRYGNLHPYNVCQGRPCIVHNPTLDWVANREGWPYLQRETGLFERICEHGIGHPDKDGLYYLVEELGQKHWEIHGCCGCCGKEED